MTTSDAARVLLLENQLGSIEQGKRADIILIDLKQAHLIPPTMLPQLLVFYGSGHDISTVLVDGEIIMENRKILTVDETRVLELALSEIENAFDRFEKMGFNMKPSTELTNEFWNGSKIHEYPFEL